MLPVNNNNNLNKKNTLMNNELTDYVIVNGTP